MKLKLFLISLVLTLLSSPAFATVLFDYTGQGGTNSSTVIEITGFDWAPNGALINDGLPLQQAGDTFTLYSMGALSVFQTTTGTANLDPAYEITFVLGMGEQVTQLMGNSAQFSLDNSLGVNFFQIYVDDTPDADVDVAGYGDTAGTGYNDGDLILSATITSAIGGFFAYNNIDDLDQSQDGDDWNGQQSINGIGSATVNVATSLVSYDHNYFLDVPNDFYLSLNDNSNNALPFTKVDPPNLFWDGTQYITPDVGAINGLTGPDMLLQTDAATSISAIPEPTTLLLLGSGLLGLVGIRRRKA